MKSIFEITVKKKDDKRDFKDEKVWWRYVIKTKRHSLTTKKRLGNTFSNTLWIKRSNYKIKELQKM